MQQFISALFNDGETTCFAKHQQGTSVYEADDPPGWALFFSINPLADRRLDVNCTAYRNFLIELDNVPLEEQRRLIDALGLPWTTCVFSGGKSFHFVVALDQGVTPDEYRSFAESLHRAVAQADHSTKNPSRLSRLPWRTRPDTQLEQELVGVRRRIGRDEFAAWLKAKDVTPAHRRRSTKKTAIEAINQHTQRLLVMGLPEHGKRYHAIFQAAVNLCAARWPAEKTVSEILRAIDFKGKDRDVRRDDVERYVRDAYAWKAARK